ncbi:hypothetical protein COF85_29590 [Bacillus toyonensis]|uniref:hypothetical protein n=1 Tax=Bacillus toyonensis TaxID=155322 RepID=UPI000BFC416D|nr:hypothetical protein [Bacillus toyonensis]PHF33206.1 hypothetical protein COF85_29590 [Bacillus toyonensis]
MLKEFKEKFPQWVNESGDYTVCLSDDLDSLVGASILKRVKGYEIKHFYDFNNFYSVDGDKRKAIGVDIALEKGMTWDNHVVRLSKYGKVNTLSANPNVIENIDRGNYTKKYAMSTALLMWSFYELPLPESDEGKMLLLSIDSSYKGHYTDFKAVQNEWLRKLGFEELIDIQNKYTLKDFANIKKKYNSSMKIELVDEQLQTGMDLEGISKVLGLPIELPICCFNIRKRFRRERIELRNYSSCTKDMIEEKHKKEIFSMALTQKNTISLTFK